MKDTLYHPSKTTRQTFTETLTETRQSDFTSEKDTTNTE